jgi:hypothetical protein
MKRRGRGPYNRPWRWWRWWRWPGRFRARLHQPLRGWARDYRLGTPQNLRQSSELSARRAAREEKKATRP